jgi:hypothetical protein
MIRVIGLFLWVIYNCGFSQSLQVLKRAGRQYPQQIQSSIGIDGNQYWVAVGYTKPDNGTEEAFIEIFSGQGFPVKSQVFKKGSNHFQFVDVVFTNNIAVVLGQETDPTTSNTKIWRGEFIWAGDSLQLQIEQYLSGDISGIYALGIRNLLDGGHLILTENRVSLNVYWDKYDAQGILVHQDSFAGPGWQKWGDIQQRPDGNGYLALVQEVSDTLPGLSAIWLNANFQPEKIQSFTELLFDPSTFCWTTDTTWIAMAQIRNALKVTRENIDIAWIQGNPNQVQIIAYWGDSTHNDAVPRNGLVLSGDSLWHTWTPNLTAYWIPGEGYRQNQLPVCVKTGVTPKTELLDSLAFYVQRGIQRDSNGIIIYGTRFKYSEQPPTGADLYVYYLPNDYHLSAETNKEKQSQKIFPNPAKDYFEIDISNTSDVLELYNLSGIKINTYTGAGPYSLLGVSAGMYYVKKENTCYRLIIKND